MQILCLKLKLPWPLLHGVCRFMFEQGDTLSNLNIELISIADIDQILIAAHQIGATNTPHLATDLEI